MIAVVTHLVSGRVRTCRFIRKRVCQPLHVCTKFDADSSIYWFKSYKGGPKISKLSHVTLGDAPFNLKR